MKCYNVKCVDENAKTYVVGVMTDSAERAAAAAEKSLLEGSHVKARTVDVEETDRI